MNCVVCNNKIERKDLLKCIGCRAGYHYACLNITSVEWSEKQVQLNSKFKCDSCAKMIQRVKITDDTPVRGMNTRSLMAEKEASVQCEEGNNDSKDYLLTQNTMSSIMETLKDFITSKIRDMETKLLQEIKTSVTALTLENSKLRQELSVCNKKCISLEDTIKLERHCNKAQGDNICPENKLLQPMTKSIQITPKVSLGNNIAHNNMNPSPQVTQTAQRAAVSSAGSLPSPAMQLTTYASVASSTAVTPTASDHSWIEVKHKTKSQPVRKGENSTILSLKAIERKKYLHVWRLDKTTTEENLLEYSKNILGVDSDIIIEKIKPKSERDYASFKIGVVESNFKKLCDPEVWPLNVEFCEWVFFRRTRSSSTTQAQPKSY